MYHLVFNANPNVELFHKKNLQLLYGHRTAINYR